MSIPILARLLPALRRSWRGDVMSEAWLQSVRHTTRVEYHGPAIRWPIHKLANEGHAPLNLKLVRRQQRKAA